jgi:hypothetical protein
MAQNTKTNNWGGLYVSTTQEFPGYRDGIKTRRFVNVYPEVLPDPVPDTSEPVDLKGIPIKVGDKVCWHIGGRRGSGIVFGVVKAIHPGKPYLRFDSESKHDVVGDEETYTTTHTNPRQVTGGIKIDVTAELKGRKGVTRDADDLLHYLTPEDYAKLNG